MEVERTTNVLTEVTTLLQEWEAAQNIQNYNAIPTLTKLADKFEKVQSDEQQLLYTNLNCEFQELLNLLVQKNFIVKLVNDYLCDGSKFNIAGCRLMLALMPGMDTSKLFPLEQDGLLQRLIKWAGNDIEPIQSYATGIIAAAMEVPEVAIAHKDQNDRLVPLMLYRLSALQTSMRLLLNDVTNEGESMPKRIKLHRDTADSGVEIKLATKQVCILRYLTSMGKDRELMSHVFKHNALELILWYVNVRETNETRLCFEALKYLAVLFRHKEFSVEFMKGTGLRCLLDIPRASRANPGVSLCLCSLARCEEVMEQICLLPKSILNNLVKYELWLLESSHDWVRCHGTNFFGNTFQFRLILEEFDEEDGLEKLHNFISNPTNLNEDNVRDVCLAYKRYFETHLNIKVEKLMEVRLQGADLIVPRQRNDKAYKPSTEHIQEQIDSLIQSMDLPNPWEPIDKLVQLGGVAWLLEVIASSSTPVETVRYALDVLAIAYVNFQGVLGFCNKEAMGMDIILGATDGKIGNDPGVQKSALRVITNCVTAPINCDVRSGFRSGKFLWRVWGSIRVSNGIMVLLQLLNVQTPVPEADCIRALACKALTGLARSKTIREIILNHPIFTSGRIQNFLQEPISQEKRHEHVEFQNYSLELLHRLGINEVTIHKRNIIAQRAQIQFEVPQLLEQYLSKKGLNETGATNLHEANKLCSQMRIVVPSEEAEHSNRSSKAYITENLANQNTVCKYSMAECPDFDLYRLHKFRTPRQLQSNYAVRSAQNQMGYKTDMLNRNLIHSRFCPVQEIPLWDDSMYCTTVRFLPGNQDILVGFNGGEIRIVNIRNINEQSSFIAHGDYSLENMEPNRNGTLLLTSATNQDSESLSALWSLNGFAMELALDSEEYVEFSKTTQDRVIGTRKELATLFDVNTGTPITRFLSNFNSTHFNNRATFSFNDDLVVSNGVLFDVRTGHRIRKLDKINPAQNGMFHPNGLEIVSDSHVWDIRTDRLLKIVPVLEDCRILFAPLNSVIYAIPFYDNMLKQPLGNSFITIDSCQYVTIRNICVQGEVRNLDVNKFDTQLAVVEYQRGRSVVRLYDVGKKKDKEVIPGAQEEDEDDYDNYSNSSTSSESDS